MSNEDFTVMAKTVSNCAVARFRDPNQSGLLILMLRTGEGDISFAMDKRMALRICEGLAQTAQQLTEPRTEY